MKKRIFAVFAVLMVLTMAIVPAFADASTDGYTTTDYINSIPERLRPAMASTVDYNPYVLVIDGTEMFDNYSALFDTGDGWYITLYSYIGYGYDVYGEIRLEYNGFGDTVDIFINSFEGTPIYNSYITINAQTQDTISLGFYSMGLFSMQVSQNATDNYMPFMDCCPIYSVLQQKKAETVLQNVEREAYNRGKADGLQEAGTVNSGKELITTAIETPFNVLTQWLNFEVLGVNVLGLVMSLLAICIVVIIIKAVIK